MNEGLCPHCFQPLPNIPEGMEIVWQHRMVMANDDGILFTPSEMKVFALLFREGGAHIKDIAKTMQIKSSNAKVQVTHVRNRLKLIGFTVTNEKKTGWLEVIKLNGENNESK